MDKTLQDALEALKLQPWIRVSVRRHGKRGVEYLGGGFSSDVVARFGDMVVVDSCIFEHFLCIYVR